MAEEARRQVTIEYDPLPAVFSLDDALRGDEIIWGEDNIFKSFTISKGRVEEAFRQAEWVIEGEYETGAQEQLYIEPNGMLAVGHARTA